MGKKWVKKKRGLFALVSILAVCIAMLVALCTTASAGYYGAGCPYDNWYNGTINGGIYFQTKGHYDKAGVTQTYTFENVPDGREIVRLYPGIWLGSPSPGRTTNFSLTINGHTENYSYTECDPYPCCNLSCNDYNCNVDITGCGVCSIYNVDTSYIKNGTNTISFWTDEQIYHVALLVVYENESMPEMQYWVKEGHEYPDGGENFSLYFNETVNTGPIDPDNIESLKFWTLGYPHCVGSKEWPTLNENYIDACDYVYSYDLGGNVHEGSPPGKEYEVLYRWDNIPPDYITSSSNHFRYPTLGNDRLIVPVLALKYGAPKLPDMVITDTWVNWPTNCTICYNLMNIGRTAAAGHNTSLFVNDGMEALDYVDVSLASGESYIGCFNYTGTYTSPSDDIAICADYNNTVDETDEDNNWLNVTWKCGDANNDGMVDLGDVLDTFDRFMYNDRQLHEWAADVNKDSTIDLGDVLDTFDRFMYGKDLNCWCEV